MTSHTSLNLSVAYDQLVDWFLFNPGASIAEASRHFSRSPSWMSTLVGSDTFQARLRDRAAELGALALSDLAARINGATLLALEKTIERLTSTENPPSERFILETTKNLTAILSAAIIAKRSPDSHFHLHASPEQLEAARERVALLYRGRASATSQEQSPGTNIPLPSSFPTEDPSDVTPLLPSTEPPLVQAHS